MVFNRSVKAGIKKALTGVLSIFILIVMVNVFVFNAVFSASGINVPVEILWDDQDASTRPAQVILHLRDKTTGTILGTATLTSSNADPDNSNRWVYIFKDLNYSVNNNYEIYQEAVSNYSITESADISFVTRIGISNYEKRTFRGNENGGEQEFDDSDFVLIGKNTFYLWADDCTSGSTFDGVYEDVENLFGGKYSVSSCEYGNPATLGGNNGVVVNYDSGYNQITATMRQGGNYEAYYGNIGTIRTGEKVTLQNIYNTSEIRNLTVHHVYENGDEFAPDVVTQYEDGDTYTATPIDNDHYSPELQSGQATGIITEDMELTYVYHPLYHNVIYQFTGDVAPSGADALLPAAEEHLHGSTVAVAQDPAAIGYRFLGWKINGADAGASFTMPTEDVIITGTWEHFNGYFTPEISKQVINKSEYYRALDTVPFEITVTNTADFDIANVVVNELLDGAVFSNGEDYQVDSDDQATIPTLAAGESITLYASYVIPKDLTQTIINTAQITSATADNYYYLDNSQEYTATASFDVRSTQDDPVLTGVHSTSTILYSILMIVGAIGVGIGIVNKKRKQKI